MSIQLERLQAGWATLSVQSHDATCRIDASFVGGRDSLEELVHLGVSAKRAVPMEVWFEGEPQQWRLALEPEAADRVSVTVHWFRDHIRRQPKDLGAPAFEAQCMGADFARAVRNVFSTWKNEQAAYQAGWHHPFPTRAFSILEQALS